MTDTKIEGMTYQPTRPSIKARQRQEQITSGLALAGLVLAAVVVIIILNNLIDSPLYRAIISALS